MFAIWPAQQILHLSVYPKGAPIRAISAAQSVTYTLVRGWKGAGKDYEVLVPKIEKARQIRLRVKSYKLHRQRS